MRKENRQLGVYTNNELGVSIRTSGTSENPLFCLSDLCVALEIGNSSQVKSRLDDGVISNEVIFDTMGRKQTAVFVTEDGFYDVILDSRKPEAKVFRKWVTSEVLPSIRKSGSYSVQQDTKKDIKLQMDVATWASKFLKLNDNSKLLLANKIAAQVGLDGVLPQYTQSKGILKPVSALLADNGISLHANAFNKILEERGFLETLERPSSKGVKKFKHITDKGLAFGENQVSPHNPKETQPLWFADRFNELYNLVNA